MNHTECWSLPPPNNKVITVKARECVFYSDGVRLDGLLQLPDEVLPETGYPAVVFCSGYQGLKELIPGKFWNALTKAGIACFSFDYRGFGTSDGDRGRLLPSEQVEDSLNALTYLRGQPEIDVSRVALVGWGFGGGIVVQSAAQDTRVAAVACLSGIGDGGRAVRDSRTYPEWFAMQERIKADRVHRVLTGEAERVSPWDIVPLEPVTRADVDREMYAKHDRFGIEMYLYSADAYYRFQPEKVAHLISPRPVLIMHGTHNGLHPIDEARSLYAHANEPKTLVELPGATHLDWIEVGHHLHEGAMQTLTDWLHEAMPSQVAGGPGTSEKGDNSALRAVPSHAGG